MNGKMIIIIIGGGPAGLSAAYELGNHKVFAICFEATNNFGGMCRTINHKGYRFDLGGHIFSTSKKEIYKLWCDLLGRDFIDLSYSTSIYYKNHYFNFPPKAIEVVEYLGIIECCKIIYSFIKYQFFPIKDVATLENSTKNIFGEYFYYCFIKDYMEKVWGTKCEFLTPEGAITVSNIKPLEMLKDKIFKNNREEGGSGYPQYGAGQMFDSMYNHAQETGIHFRHDSKVLKLILNDKHVKSIIIKTPEGTDQIPASYVLSSVPLKDLVKMISPELSDSVLDAASRLRYRSMVIVNLILEPQVHIPFGCINIQDPNIKMSRIHCFKNWSEKMVPDRSKCSLECEYFVSENDELWKASDEALISTAKDELKKIGLASIKDVIEGFVIRIPKAYPLLTIDYIKLLKIIHSELNEIDNLQIIGRGTHTYDSMDDAILTGLLASRNILKIYNDV